MKNKDEIFDEAITELSQLLLHVNKCKTNLEDNRIVYCYENLSTLFDALQVVRDKLKKIPHNKQMRLIDE